MDNEYEPRITNLEAQVADLTERITRLEDRGRYGVPVRDLLEICIATFLVFGFIAGGIFLISQTDSQFDEEKICNRQHTNNA